jgi:hypothetical protein
LAVGFAIAGSAFAAPNVSNTTQKGSLLIFPDIRVDQGWNTLVRLENAGSTNGYVRCYWMDGNKNRVDFVIPVTRNQAVWFDAATGDGTYQVNRFPAVPADGFDNPFLPGGTVPYLRGLLVCWALDEFGWNNQVKWNHLSGTATVHHPTIGAYEYSAYAFFLRTGLELEAVGTAGTINMNGVEFDTCPQYLIGRFSPAGAPAEGAPTVAGHRLAIMGCRLNLNWDGQPVWTRLQFDVWNEDGVKFTGASECSDGWHETTFTQGTVAVGGLARGINGFEDGLDAQGDNFALATLGTYAARYRVEGVQSSQCENANIKTRAVGLLGVQSTFLQGKAVGTTLASVGTLTGRIVWDPSSGDTEGGIR